MSMETWSRLLSLQIKVLVLVALQIAVCAAMFAFPFVVIMVTIRFLEIAAWLIWVGGSIFQPGG
jgi:hypothetical protein